MLFRKKPKRCCGLCLYATATEEEGVVQCQKKGNRDYNAKCMAFTYDPCKRVPSRAKALNTHKYEEYDYSL